MTGNPRRLRRAMVAVALGATTAGVWSHGPAGAADPAPPPYTRTVTPEDPENPPSTPPAVDLTAACVRPVGRRNFEAIFGYESHAAQSVLVALGPDLPVPNSDQPNLILHEIIDGPVFLEVLGPQVTLFKPGRDRHAFAVRFSRDERVTWQVTLPAEDGSGSWIVNVSPRMSAACPANVPDHFAVVQSAKQAIPEPANLEEAQDPFHITAYDIAQRFDSVRVACSHGGEQLEPKVRFGWPEGMNVGPVKVNYFVDVVRSGGTVTYEMTRKSTRPVADIFQEARWLGPIGDVTARCAFGKKVVTSDVFWSEVTGGGHTIPEVVDGLLVSIGLTQDAPLGTRLR